jgi:hypothetical protein
MQTSSAVRSLASVDTTIVGVRELIAAGWTSDAIRGQVRARRWQRIGRAVVLHNGTPSVREWRDIVLVLLRPRATLTAFTALEEWGLEGWERDAVHVLVPRGARVVRPAGGPAVRVHYTDKWRPDAMHQGRQLHRPADAAVLAASTFATLRPACGILAAVVQQRLARPQHIVAALEQSSRVRHRAGLLSAALDIEQGARALSEIDFAKLCRRAALPIPTRQAVRCDASGKRRYLDAEWPLSDGRRLVVEVDGALHLIVRRWWDDQLRQNEVVLGGGLLLRYPSVVVRCEEALVVGQLRQVLT